MSRNRTRFVLKPAIQGAGIVALFVALLGFAPPAAFFLKDPDAGTQLTYAMLALRGIHPYVDLPTSVGGPLLFYASAIAQWLSGNALLGEVVLCALGYALALFAWFRVVRDATSTRLFAGATVLLALLLLPRFYKYYVVLLPMLVILSMHGFLRRPADGRALVLGLAIAATGFFRVDLGMFTAAAAFPFIAAASFVGDMRTRIRFTLLAAAPVLVSLSIWFAWLAFKGEVISIISMNIAVGQHVGSGMSLPFPGIDASAWPSRHAAFALGFWVFLLAPPVAALILLSPVGSSQSPTHRTFLLFLCVFAVLTYIQSWHRTDVSHFLQALPVALLAVLLSVDTFAGPSGPRKWGIRGALLVLLATLLYPLFQPMPYIRGVPAVVEKISDWRVPAHRWVRHQHGESAWMAAAIQSLQSSTSRSEAVLAIPYATQAYYFADRPFAGPFPAVFPGLFDIPTVPESMLESLQHTSAIMDLPWLRIDPKPENQPREHASAFMEAIYAHFQIRSQHGAALVLAPRSASPSAGGFAVKFARSDPGNPGEAQPADIALNTIDSTRLTDAQIDVVQGNGLLVTLSGLELPVAPWQCVQLSSAKATYATGPSVIEVRSGRRRQLVPAAIDTGDVAPGHFAVFLRNCDNNAIRPTAASVRILARTE